MIARRAFLQAIAKTVETLCYWVRFRHSPLCYLFQPPSLPPTQLSMLNEIRNSIQPSKRQHLKGGGGGRGEVDLYYIVYWLLECIICRK